jgi:hypothetical protein
MRRGLSPLGLHGAVSVPGKSAAAASLFDIASGMRIPVELCIDDWLAESNYAMRTKADHRHAMSELKRWLGDSEGIRLAAATGQFRGVERAFTRAGRTTGGRAGSTRVA